MEVTRKNFSSTFSQIEQCMLKSEFIAIDTEFTGLHARAEDGPSFFDTMEERYQKLKRFAQAFTICQFGLSAFVKCQSSNKYVAHTYNFYLHQRPCGDLFLQCGIQASNAQFLCEHNFDFNKMFYEGIGYLNQKQKDELQGKSLSEKELKEAIGFSRVFQLLVDRKKPLLGHNMLNDLVLMYEKFHKPLPNTYVEFKQEIHKLFPVLIDTKNLCFALQKRLSVTKLVEFTSLVDIYEALGSQRGTYYVLCSPEIVLPEESSKYATTKAPHEAGFDAYCVGFVFLRLAHLTAMKGVDSVHAHPVHIRQYFRLMEPFTNRVNLIRGPIQYIDFSGPDPPPFRSECLVVKRKDGLPISVQMLYDHLEFGSMDIQFPSETTAHIVLSSRTRCNAILQSNEDSPFIIRRFNWLLDSHALKEILWKLVIPGIGIGLLGMAVGLSVDKMKKH